MIHFQNVSKVYKSDIAALRDVTAEISKGEFVFIVGPSGSGKSTFLSELGMVRDQARGVYGVGQTEVLRDSSDKM